MSSLNLILVEVIQFSITATPIFFTHLHWSFSVDQDMFSLTPLRARVCNLLFNSRVYNGQIIHPINVQIVEMMFDCQFSTDNWLPTFELKYIINNNVVVITACQFSECYLIIECIPPTLHIYRTHLRDLVLHWFFKGLNNTVSSQFSETHQALWWARQYEQFFVMLGTREIRNFCFHLK